MGENYFMEEKIMSIEEIKAELLLGNRFRLTGDLHIAGALLIGVDRILTDNDLDKLSDKVSVLRVTKVIEEKEKKNEKAGILLAHINEIFEDNLFKKLIETKKDIIKKIFSRILPSNDFLIDKLFEIREFSDKLFIHSVRVAIISLITDWAYQRAKKHHKMRNALEFEHTLTGALLHDIGFLNLPVEVIEEKRLDILDNDGYKLHTNFGFDIVKSVSDEKCNKESRLIIRDHHEKIDGSGFPTGAKGEEISKLAQVVCLSDEFELLMTGELSLRERPFNDIARKLSTSAKLFNRKMINLIIEEFRYLVV